MSDPNVTGALSRNPTTGQVIEHFRFQTDREIEQLLAEASAAYRAWRATPMTSRVKMGSGAQWP
jgi:succinate-semialdehyde dehydrogenase